MTKIKKKKCEYCGKELEGKWIYCSNECVAEANARSIKEGDVLRRREKNAKLLMKVYALELEAEGNFTTTEFFVSKQEEKVHLALMDEHDIM